MLHLDYRDARPIYEQIKDGLRKLMVNGVLQEGEKLPSVRTLASSLAINPNTIQRAYRELESEGYICTGSLYLCTTGFLPLGLPASAPFWDSGYEDWTSRKIWSGADMPADHSVG